MREAFSCLAVCRTKVSFCGWCDGGAHGSNMAQAKNAANFNSCIENAFTFYAKLHLEFPSISLLNCLFRNVNTECEC